MTVIAVPEPSYLVMQKAGLLNRMDTALEVEGENLSVKCFFLSSCQGRVTGYVFGPDLIRSLLLQQLSGPKLVMAKVG